MATKKTESEKKFKREIPEEAREHYKKARQEMREAIKGCYPKASWNTAEPPAKK